MNRILLAMCSLGAAAGALTGCDADGNRKGLVVTPGMVDSIPYDAYDENPFGGQTLRLAPKGTVPYGGKRYFYGPTPEEGVRAGAELQNPIEPTAENLARGKDRYETFCLVCHGASGAGHGPIIGPLPKRIPAPPPYDVRAKGLPDGHLFHIMTYGQGSMASYAVQVQQDDRWRIIHYIRTLQGIAPGSVPPGIPAATSGAGGQGGAGGGEGGAGGEGGQGGAGGQGGGGHGGAGGNAGDQGGAGGDEPWEFDNLPRPPPLPDAPEPPRPAPKPAPKPLPKPGPAPKPPAGDPYD